LGVKLEDANNDDIMAKKERFLAMCFLCRSDEGRYGDLLANLMKGVILGRYEYARSVADAYQLMLRHVKENNRRTGFRHPNQSQGRGTGVMLAQRGQGNSEEHDNTDPVPGNDGILHEDITFYTCRRREHYAGNCLGQTAHTVSQTTGHS